jgi:hypothetical protein
MNEFQQKKFTFAWIICTIPSVIFYIHRLHRVLLHEGRTELIKLQLFLSSELLYSRV